MLVLARKVNQKIYIGKDIVVKVLQIRGNLVRLGIIAPKEFNILREEVRDRNADNQQEGKWEPEYDPDLSV